MEAQMSARSIGFIALTVLSVGSIASFVACGDSESTNPLVTTTSVSSTGTTGSGGAGGAGGAAGGGGNTANGGGGNGGAAAGGGGSGGASDKSAGCVGTFGNALTSPFGRIDGTVVAIVKPTDQQCPMPNSDHVIVEVKMNGDVYRMVVNVESDQGPPDVYFLEKAGTLPAPKWSEGWHLNAPLDYVADLKAHSTDFTTYDITLLSDLVTRKIPLNGKVSVYAATDGGSSAHLVHKNDGTNADGAIVIDADTDAPEFLLFHFDEQVF
jgi:hypothetical protein